MNGAFADAVVFESNGWQWLQKRLLRFKHRAYLLFGRTVNARRGPTLVPAQQQGILLVDGLEASPFQCRFLRVTDRGFNFAFEIGRIWVYTEAAQCRGARASSRRARSIPDRRCLA